MPGLAYRKDSQSSSCHNSPSSSSSSSPSPSPSSASDRNGGRSASCHRRDSVETSQLNMFWRDLSSSARKELLQVDKHTLFEQVRKNLYCSRCNGLLLEAFSQLVSYSKSIQGSSSYGKKTSACSKTHSERQDSEVSCVVEDDVRDPSVHPWGGLMATRENTLSVLDCFVEGQPLEVIQNVCDCARARERERQLLYPDACGGGGRGWISQGTSSSSSCRGHNLKETCALHTARLSCDALVDFWSALGEETRRSLLRMKEEDFVARLMFRFDNKRFCRDCRRNVLRELKELKELKRARKEPKCTRWFCNADTAFLYEVSNTSVLANWSDCFGGDLVSTYERFEWGLGSTEGGCDILGFEDVGLSEGARVDGLDLSQFSFFYITLRAWKHEGRCTELSVKAHGLKGRHCVHRRLLVGDGHVTITKGESIKRFFEQAEEAEEEEDEEASDKNGSDPESEGFRVQKHAKSPELARDFLLDAATIIFKEQVEKAFREGTARQNAHTIFVCLALNLLEERVHVACKEISTLEMQKKLLEEEEHEKREEEMRRERKRLKEKEKKNRRKEKQKNLKRGKEKTKYESPSCSNSNDCDSSVTNLQDGNVDASSDNEIKGSTGSSDGVKANEELISLRLELPVANISDCNFDFSASMERSDVLDDGEMFVVEQSKASKRRSKMRRGTVMEIVSQRSFRQSDVGSRSFTKVSSSSSFNELSEKHHRKATKSDRTMLSTSVSIETWTNVRYQQEMSPSCQVSNKRALYVKSVQNDSAKESLEIRNMDKKNATKQLNRVGCIVSGTDQCNWQVVKGPSGAAVKKESSVSNAVIPDSSNHGKDLSPAGSDRSLSRNFLDGYNDQESEEISEQQVDVNALDGNHLTTSGSEVESAFGSIKVDSSFKCPPELAPSGKEKPLPRLLPISTTGSVDEDASPSSSSSFFTDTSDNGVSSSSVTTDSSYVESAEASASEVSMEVPRCQGSYNEYAEAMHYNNVNEGCLQYDLPSYHIDDYNAYNNFSCTEFYPYSCDPNIIAYGHDYPCAYEPVPLGILPDVQVIDVTPNVCEIDSTMQIPLTSQSLLPLQPSQPFGFSWVHRQCVGAPVMDAGLAPFHHPGSVYMDLVPSSNGVHPPGLLPMPPPFQHSATVVGYDCVPDLSTEQTYTCWTEQQLVYKDELQRESPLLGHNPSPQQVPASNLCPKDEEHTELSSVTGINGPSNDPLGKFSLFHFGSLSPEEQEQATAEVSRENKNGDINNLSISCSRSFQQESAGTQNPDQPENEYHLFAATPSNRFSFFKERLHECWQAPFIL